MLFRSVLVCAFSLLILPVFGFAAEETADKAERIEVTGSHIKRIDTEGVSTVQTITKQDLDKKGYDNLGDVVRDMGSNSFGSGTVSGNSSTPGNADISLRGLGAGNTLVLLNGQRLPQDAIAGSVDINLIPMAAVERIEILKDGASAVYGSDALAGVVNIITRKDFKGTELNVSQSLLASDFKGGKKTTASIVNGINTEKLNLVTTLAYRHDQAINSRDRPWSNDGLSAIGSPGSYYDITTSGGWKASTNCPSGLVIKGLCRFQYSDYSQETPKISQLSGMSEAHYELSSNVRLYGRVSVVHRTVQNVLAPSPGLWDGNGDDPQPITSSNWSADSGLSGVSNGDQLAIRFRTLALGNRVTDVTTNSYGGVLGATVQLPGSWQMDLTNTYTFVKSDLEGTSGFARADVLTQLIQAGTVNPFGPRGSQGPVSSAAYVPSEISKSRLAGFEAKASGDLAEVSSGTVGLAFGTMVNYSDYSDSTDAQTLNKNVIGNAGSSGYGHRTAEALYTELSIPVFEKKVELQLAGRFDHYSDFGSTVNPKFGVLYHATPSWLIRGTVGTGFRAPLLNELYAGKSVGYPEFIDQVACARHGGDYCQAAQYQTTNSGNSKLKEETSTSYTAGIIYEPAKNFNIGTDWFITKIKNIPGISLDDLTRAEANGVSLSKYGVTTIRGSDGTISDALLSVIAPLQNLGSTQEFGVDISTSYSWWKMKFATEQNQLFYYKTVGFPELPLQNELGWAGMPRWRNTTSLSYFHSEPQSLSLIARTIAGQSASDKVGWIHQTTTLDLSYVYKTKQWGDFSVAVINLINTLPPYDTSSPQSRVNYSLYDPNGRQVVLAYKKTL